MKERELPDRPVRTLSSVKGTQKSQPSVDRRTSLTPSSDTSHLRLVSLTTPGLPQGTSPQPAQHPAFVSLKHRESFFPHQTTAFFPPHLLNFLLPTAVPGATIRFLVGKSFEAPQHIRLVTLNLHPLAPQHFSKVFIFSSAVLTLPSVYKGSSALSQQRSQTFV